MLSVYFRSTFVIKRCSNTVCTIFRSPTVSGKPRTTESFTQDEIARIRKWKRGRNMLNRSGNTTDNLCFRYRFRDVFSRFRCCVYNGTGPLLRKHNGNMELHVSATFQKYGNMWFRPVSVLETRLQMQKLSTSQMNQLTGSLILHSLVTILVFSRFFVRWTAGKLNKHWPATPCKYINWWQDTKHKPGLCKSSVFSK